MNDETQNYEQFFDRFLDAFDFEDIPEDERGEFFAEIGDLLVEGILTEASLALPEEHQDGLERLMAEADIASTPEEIIAAQQELFGFLEEHVPDFTTIVAEQGKELIESYKATKEEYGVLDDTTEATPKDDNESLDAQVEDDDEDSIDDERS